MNLSNYATSLVRTWVPIVVGTVAGWIAAKTGFIVDEETQASVISAVVGAVIAGYYAVVRWLEIKFPQAGWLLGVPKAPGYSPAAVPPARPSPGSNEEI